MKKFLAIAASAVLAFGMVAFVACEDKEAGGSAESATYKQVDLSTAEKKRAFVDEVSSKMDVEKLFGDVSADDFSVGLALDMNFKSEVSVSAKDFPVSPVAKKDLAASAKLNFDESLKIKASEKDRLASSKANVSFSAKLPDELMDMMGTPDGAPEWMTLVTSLLSGFDYSLNSYLDNEYVYVQYPQNILEMLPEEAQGVLPESGKVKIPYADLLNPSYPAIPEGYATASSASTETALIVEQVMEMLINYNVDIAVSTENGYAVRLTAQKDALLNILGDVTGDTQTVAMIDQFATFNTCAITAYLAVDNDGAFKEVSVKVDLDATIKIAANLIQQGIPEINGSIKLNTGISVKKYDGKITLPSDLDNYIDIMSATD